jgi:hypothetical protein
MMELTNAEMLKVKMAERKIFEHLEYGGKIDDDMGQQILSNFIDKLADIKTVKETIERYGDNVGSVEIMVLFMSMIKHLMPNPVLNVGGNPLLVTTLIVMEIHRLDEILSVIHSKLPRISSPEELEQVQPERIRIIVEEANKVSQLIYDVGKSNVGETNFTIKNEGGAKSAQGCLVTLIAGGCFVYLGTTLIELI